MGVQLFACRCFVCGLVGPARGSAEFALSTARQSGWLEDGKRMICPECMDQYWFEHWFVYPQVSDFRPVVEE